MSVHTFTRLGRPRRRVLAGVVAGALAVAGSAGAAQAAGPVAGGRTAAAPPTGPITLAQAVQIALTQNTTVLTARNNVALDESGIRQARMNFLPDLRATTGTGASLGRNFDQSEGRIITQTTQSVSAGFASSYTIWDGGRSTAGLRQARLTAGATEQDLSRARQTAVFTVASDYLALIRQQEQLRIDQQNLISQQETQSQIQKFVDAGSRAISDLYQQEATVAAAQSTVIDAQNSVELANVDLIQVLELDPRGTYTFVAPAMPDTVHALQFSLDSLLTVAMRLRPDLAAESGRISADDAAVSAAADGRMPTISLSAGYNTAFSSATATDFLDQLDQRRGGTLNIGLSVPVYDKGSTSVSAERAALAQDDARLQLVSDRQEVALEVRRAYLDYLSAQQQLVAANAQVTAAQLALTTSQQRYQVGLAALLDVTQASASLLQAESNQSSAKYNLFFQRVLLDYYDGSLDPAHVSINGS
ncbi:MAG TPA: TolC family protein [Gemmatimonadaceae bacterium]|nr:TolC family protein [Gemmatimonadaceae bacterium]